MDTQRPPLRKMMCTVTGICVAVNHHSYSYISWMTMTDLESKGIVVHCRFSPSLAIGVNQPFTHSS